MIDLKLQRVEWHGDGIYSLFLERQGLCFSPGDCVALFAEDGESSRPYSIASGTGDDELEFLIRRIPGGVLSDSLHARRVGETIKVSPPFGWFHPGAIPAGTPFVYFATGTGIAPLLSHLRSGGVSPRQVFYGVRVASDLLAIPDVTDLHCAVSREFVEGRFHGRITHMMDQVDLQVGMHYFACGVDAMVEDVKRALEERGVPFECCHGECFFNQQAGD